MTDDGGVVILAGSCVGGGTTVNWAASFRTPRHVRLEWARKLGLKSFEPGGPYDKALDAVCDRLGVSETCVMLALRFLSLSEMCVMCAMRARRPRS